MGDLLNDWPERSDRLTIRGRSANYLERSERLNSRDLSTNRLERLKRKTCQLIEETVPPIASSTNRTIGHNEVRKFFNIFSFYSTQFTLRDIFSFFWTNSGFFGSRWKSGIMRSKKFSSICSFYSTQFTLRDVFSSILDQF